MNRRHFLAANAGLLVATSGGIARGQANERIRIGIVGTGLRGQVHIEELLKRRDVDITAICDIEQFMLDKALKLIADAGGKRPQVFTGHVNAWQEMFAKAQLDAVIIATPWDLHAVQSIAAMEAKIAVGCEVVAGITLADHWAVLRAQRNTGTPYMLLENVCYRRDVLAVLNMARRDVFGEIVHVEGGYQHDLRAVKLNSGVAGKPYGGGVEFGAKGWSESKWRTEQAIRRNGDLYPSHGIGPCAMWLDIHRGNRFTRLTSYASKARGLRDYIAKNAPGDHPNKAVKFALGDVVQTQLQCANGETVLLTHDTSLPRPYSLGFRVQGTRGLWMDVNKSIYVEGASPQAHRWEPAEAWLSKFDHPLWKRHAAAAADAGHGGMDFFVIHAFIEALKRAAPMPIDIFDAVAWSAITPLSERSIAEASQTLDFPDFTEGAWLNRKRSFALDDLY